MTAESTAKRCNGLPTGLANRCRSLFAGSLEERFPREDVVRFIPALLVCALVTLRANALIHDGDTYWHIAAGKWMLAHHAVLHSDPFSYTFAGHPWLTHEWLSEVIMAFTFGAGGWHALDLLFGLTAGTTAILLARHYLRYLEPVPAVALLMLALYCTVPSLLLRPHSLAVPLLVAWTSALLWARDQNRAPSWTMLILMVAWANLHASFIVGLFLVAVFALEAATESGKHWWHALWRWIPFGLGAALAAVITPHGVQGLIFPLKLMSDTALLALVNEFQTSVFTTITPLEVLLLSTMLFAFLRPTRVPLIRLLLFLLLVHMSLEHRREIYILGSVGLMILAKPVAEALAPRPVNGARTKAGKPISIMAAASTALVAVLIVAIRFAISANPPNSWIAPNTALAHVPASVATQPVFNDYSMGGYLIFHGIRPFIDGRGDMYGAAFCENYAKIIKPDRRAIETTFSRYRIVWTILPPDNAANEILDLLPGWRVLYRDEFTIVHVRNESFAPAHP